MCYSPPFVCGGRADGGGSTDQGLAGGKPSIRGAPEEKEAGRTAVAGR